MPTYGHYRQHNCAVRADGMSRQPVSKYAPSQCTHNGFESHYCSDEYSYITKGMLFLHYGYGRIHV